MSVVVPSGVDAVVSRVAVIVGSALGGLVGVYKFVTCPAGPLYLTLVFVWVLDRQYDFGKAKKF